MFDAHGYGGGYRPQLLPQSRDSGLAAIRARIQTAKLMELC
jgi:hypothetical protein